MYIDARISSNLFKELKSHLFPGDSKEHIVLLEAGLKSASDNYTLLIRKMIIPKIGKELVIGSDGHWQLTSNFILTQILSCKEKKLVYLSAHNHNCNEEVTFSEVDLQSHNRLFPQLLDINKGLPVGGLVFSENCYAGDIWISRKLQFPLKQLTIVGPKISVINCTTNVSVENNVKDEFDRQKQFFGNKGQLKLKDLKIAIVGLGGVGMLLSEWLSKLGVGKFILIDSDKIETSNISRIPLANHWHAMSWFTKDKRSSFVKQLGKLLSRYKVVHSKKIIRKSNKNAQIIPLKMKLENKIAIDHIKNCDYIFLAADTQKARWLFNAICHQYLIPGIQIGSRIDVDSHTSKVKDAFSIVRPVTVTSGCLLCNSAIDHDRLRAEDLSEDILQEQKYIVGKKISEASSVITLNAEGTGRAANIFLFQILELSNLEESIPYSRFHSVDFIFNNIAPNKEPNCKFCGLNNKSRFARGDNFKLKFICNEN